VSFWQAWRERRALRSGAEAFAASAWLEPDDADVRWLAERATAGDEDHARWELRYCRRALALLAAERDALDDRTGAEVSHAMLDRLHADRGIAPERLPMAERQFNARLGRYREALRERGPRLAERFAGVLAATAAGAAARPGPPDPRLVDIADAYWARAQRELKACFGTAQLPEHVRPSEAVKEGGRAR
jgi:hypothetical protein